MSIFNTKCFNEEYEVHATRIPSLNVYVRERGLTLLIAYQVSTSLSTSISTVQHKISSSDQRKKT